MCVLQMADLDVNITGFFFGTLTMTPLSHGKPASTRTSSVILGTQECDKENAPKYPSDCSIHY